MTIESESPPIPQNEFFPTTDSTGKVVLFHVYVDTYLLITEGAQKEGVVVTESTEDIDFIKIVTKKFKRNFVSLLRSITNTRGANLSNDMLLHLFDEDGKLYDASNYKKSIYALLLDKDTKVSNFYETGSSSDFLPKDSIIECNTAYFTFKMRFKYKLLDFVVQFELGHNLYQDNNEYDHDDLQIFKDVQICGNLEINNNLAVLCEANFCKTVKIGTTNSASALKVYGNVDIGDVCSTHDVKIYGKDNTYSLWDNNNGTLSLQGKLVVGTDESGYVPNYDVIFYGTDNHKLTWKSASNELEILGSLEVNEISSFNDDVTIGTPLNGADFTVYGSSSNNCIYWDKTLDKLTIKGAMHVGEIGTGHTVQFNGSNNKYMKWDESANKLTVHGSIIGGSECNGEKFKVWGNIADHSIEWDNSINKLIISGKLDVGTVDISQMVTLYGKIDGVNKNVVWDGTTGQLLNEGTTLFQGVSEFTNNVTIGSQGCNNQLLVHGSGVTNSLSWVDNALTITGFLTVSEKTTLNGELETTNDVLFKSSLEGKSVNWDSSCYKLKVTGTTELCGTVNINSVNDSETTINSQLTVNEETQLNHNLLIGVDGCGHGVKIYGNTTNKYVEWIPLENTLKINGITTINDNLNTTSDVNINGNDNSHNIQWDASTNKCTVNGELILNDTVTVNSLLKVDTTGTVNLIGNNSKSVLWENDKLVVNSDLDVNNNNLNVVDSNLSAVSCSNNNYMKWVTDTSEFKVKGASTIDGSLILPTDNAAIYIEWDGTSKLLSKAEVEVNSNNLSVIDGDFTINNTVSSNNIVWNNATSSLTVSSDVQFNFNNALSDNYYVKCDFANKNLIVNVPTNINQNVVIGSGVNNVSWDNTTSVLTSTANIVTNNDLTINGCDTCVNKSVVWDCSDGTLTANGIVKLISDTTTKYVEWNNTDTLLVSSNLNIKQGDINIFDTADTSRIYWDASDNTLTTTGSEVILQHDNTDKKVHWNPNDKLYINAPVLIDMTLTTNADIQINGCNTCTTKNIQWVCETGVLTTNASDLIVNNVSHFNNNVTTTGADVLFNGCTTNNNLLWDSSANKLSTIGADIVFNGSTANCSMEWDTDYDKLTVKGDVIMSGECSSGSSPYYTEWNQANTRLTVSGNIVKAPSSILTCGDVALDMNTANNFHITLNGNINLQNPTNATPGQEGRIVILTSGTNRLISFGSAWQFENCNTATLSDIDTTDVLVYYVLNSSFIMVRIEKNYGCPPPGSC